MSDNPVDPEKIKKTIEKLRQDIESDEGTRKLANKMLSEAKEILAYDPDDQGTISVIDNINDTIKTCAENIEHYTAQIAALQDQLPKAKWDVAAHPLAQLMAEEPAVSAAPREFGSGEMCEAKWSDHQWYKAKVRLVMGPPGNRIYRVRFVDYADQEMQVNSHNIRPPQESKKRKLDVVAPPPPAAPKQVTSAVVISAPATKNPNAQRTPKENNAATAPATDRPVKKHKVASKARVEQGANNWKNFSKVMEKKGPKKESMFRTSDNPNARVGVSGSGPQRTKAPTKIRAFKPDNDNQEPEEDEGPDRWELARLNGQT